MASTFSLSNLSELFHINNPALNAACVCHLFRARGTSYERTYDIMWMYENHDYLRAPNCSS